jgi:nucleoporin NDC1
MRRKAIYEDIDRKDGPMWSQIYMICLTLIKSMETRVDEYGKAPAPAALPAGDVGQPKPQARVTAPLKEDPIFQNKAATKSMRGEVEKVVGQLARSPGHSPVSQLSPIAKKTLRDARDKILSKERQEALAPENVKSHLHELAIQVISYDWIGGWFKEGFNRRLTAAVFGTPYAELSLYINAASVLSLLAVHSLTEDKFGNVHRDVPTIIRTFTAVIKKLEGFKARFPTHWTDITPNKETPEVDKVLDALKTALAQVVEAFEQYSSDLRLTLKDVRLAKEAAMKAVTEEVVKEKQMEQVR